MGHAWFVREEALGSSKSLCAQSHATERIKVIHLLLTQWTVKIITRVWCSHCFMSSDESVKEAKKITTDTLCSTLGWGQPLFNVVLKKSTRKIKTALCEFCTLYLICPGRPFQEKRCYRVTSGLTRERRWNTPLCEVRVFQIFTFP